MAKAIVVAFNGEESSFAFAKLDRSRLYGARRRVPLDQSGLVIFSVWELRTPRRIRLQEF